MTQRPRFYLNWCSCRPKNSLWDNKNGIHDGPDERNTLDTGLRLLLCWFKCKKTLFLVLKLRPRIIPAKQDKGEVDRYLHQLHAVVPNLRMCTATSAQKCPASRGCWSRVSILLWAFLRCATIKRNSVYIQFSHEVGSWVRFFFPRYVELTSRRIPNFCSVRVSPMADAIRTGLI